MEPVAHAGFGEQVAGASRVRFELAPQLSHVQPQVSTRGLVAGPPHLSEQLPLANEFAGVPQQDLEQVPLGWRKPHLNLGGAIGERDAPGSQVNSGWPKRHDRVVAGRRRTSRNGPQPGHKLRSEEHTSELQSRQYLVCRLLLEKKK